jgi:hypothetical protein
MTTPVSPGFGLAPFGTTPFGMPETTPPARVALEPIAAKQIDPATQSFVVNDYGQYVGTTSVLQWVVMQITLVQRSIPSDIELGNPSHRHPTLDSAHAQRVKAQLLQRLNTRAVRRQLQIHELIVEVRGDATLIGLDVTDLTTGTRTGKIEYAYA